MKYLIIFYYFVLFVSALDNPTVTLQVTSGKDSYCNNEDVFGPLKLSLNDVPQFSAMCDISPPKENQLEILLENNVIPILCMGLYDVFQRLCKAAVKNPVILKETPWAAEKINDVFHVISNQENYSSLDQFCGNTVKKNLIIEPASKESEFWWKELNHQLNTSSNCQRICRTNENNKVQPLCSFIIWANEEYIKSNIDNDFKTDKIGERKGNLLQKNVRVVLNSNTFESNQIVPSVGQANYTPTSSTMDSSHVKEQSTEFNLTNTIKQIDTSSKNSTSQAISSDIVVEMHKEKESQNKEKVIEAITEQSKTNKTVTDKNDTKLYIQQNNENEEPKVNVFSPNILPLQKVEHTSKEGGENTLSSKLIVSNQEPNNGKTIVTPENVGNSGKPALVDGGKNTVAEKPSESMDDFTLDVTPFGIEIEQPNLAGEEEDLDGGEDTELGSSIKSATNEKEISLDTMKSSNPQPNLPSFDKGETNKPYGEVQEVIIKDGFIETEDSNFFSYFLCMAVLTILAYLVFHNKKKLLALAVEGRRSKSGRRRPNSSNYSKLDCSLEEAMASNTTASVTHVLY